MRRLVDCVVRSRLEIEAVCRVVDPSPAVCGCVGDRICSECMSFCYFIIESNTRAA